MAVAAVAMLPVAMAGLVGRGVGIGLAMHVMVGIMVGRGRP